jgi:crotonobetainyl-CoA:carnitine CoA-transferase CaiB-like acyl-CoA transferase
VRSPINLSRFPHAATFDNAAPDPGSDSEDVLADLGIAGDRIHALKSAGVI